MFKLINMKTIGAVAISMSLILGTLAAPASTAFAKGTFNKSVVSLGKYSTTHLYRTFIRVDQSKSRHVFDEAFRIGNRSIGY